MAADLLLGIDTGTSVVKAALFDREGRELTTAAQRTHLIVEREGWSETDMDATWAAAAGALRELMARPGVTPERVAAVGVSGNMIGAWLIDASGRPVRNAILWNDGRTVRLLDQLRAEQQGFDTRIFNISGSVIEHGATLPVLRWLADHEPEAVQRAAWLLHSKDWIRFKLTGEIVTEASEVPGMPADARTRDYSDEVLAWFGLSDCRRLFPPIAASQQIVGRVTPQAAALTGLAAGTPVAAGTGDVPAVVLGVGAVEPGVACSILGTHSINGIILDQPSFEPVNVGILFTIPEQRWMRAMTNIAGTTNLDWFIEQFCALEQAQHPGSAALFEHLEGLVGQSPPGARGVLYHPYLSAVGIMAPFIEPAARAQFIGLTREHTKADLLRAVFEGVALAIRDCYSAMGAQVREMRLPGGGARSRVWGQIIADTVGAPVMIPAGSEFGARGAALLAGVGIGWFDSIVEAAASAIQIDRVYQPNPRLKALYDENYALYSAARDALRPVWHLAASREHLAL